MTDTKAIKSMLDAIDGVYEVDKTAFTLQDDTWKKSRQTFHLFDCLANWGKCRLYLIIYDFSKNHSLKNIYTDGKVYIRFRDVPLEAYNRLIQSTSRNPTASWCGELNLYASSDLQHIIQIDRGGVLKVLDSETKDGQIFIDFVIEYTAELLEDGFKVIVYNTPDSGSAQHDKKLARVFNKGVKSFGDFFEEDNE